MMIHTSCVPKVGQSPMFVKSLAYCKKCYIINIIKLSRYNILVTQVNKYLVQNFYIILNKRKIYIRKYIFYR